MVQVRKVEKDLSKVFLDKTTEFFYVMKYAQGQSLWNATGLNGIHCAISVCDALTCFYLGERAAGERHEDVVVMLRKIEIKDIESKIKQILSILSVKNLVEYEARDFRKSDALKITIQVERLYTWAKEFLPK